MSMMSLLLFVGGLLLLVGGAEVFIRGSVRLAAAFGVSPLVIGLTIVGFGTSTPELAVSIQSGFAGQTDIALGNVVGSNILNVLFILGITAIILPLSVSQQLIRLDVPILIGVSVLLLVFGLDGKLTPLEGGALVFGGIVYTAFLVVQSRKENQEVQDEYAREFSPPTQWSPREGALNALLILGGLASLVLGSRWLVTSAIAFAQALGVSELVIGLTIVAVGTSLPEIATSVIAGIRGEMDIAVGNIIGSSIFNILAVLGISSMVVPGGIPISPAALRFDIPIMVAVAVACLPIFFTGNLIARWEGMMFLAYYVAYTVYLVLKSTHHASLPLFSMAMTVFVIPITIITLLTVTWRSWKDRGKRDVHSNST